VKLGSASAFRGLAVFVVVVAALLALRRSGMPDFTGVLWWVIVLAASLYLALKGFARRNGPDGSRGPGGWGAVMPPKLSRWMLGEDDTDRR
jgi:hypothetical protein